MSTLELILLSLALAMDAFAVSVCKGLALQRPKLRHALACGICFGFFQALMPLMGYALGMRCSAMIARFDHWIAFFLLGIIGLNMAREALGEDHGGLDDDLHLRTLLLLAIATSIDALAAGVSFAFLQMHILPAVICIGGITCCLCMLGVRLGGAFGLKRKKRAQLGGGLVLMGMGIKILAEHLLG